MDRLYNCEKKSIFQSIESAMNLCRREFMKRTLVSACAGGALAGFSPALSAADERGSQRLSLERLRQWEELQYGMFIHFGMSTFDGDELSKGQMPSSLYAPDRLDVDQWISVARDAGMKYAILTTKHVAGHCLWPTAHTDYSVATSGNTTDVVGKFVQACEKRGIKPGFYYCSWDNHNRFGSMTPSYTEWSDIMNSFPRDQTGQMPPFTTSLYHNFQTAQITELIKNYSPIMEMWIDIPGVLGRGYRTFLYHYVAELQPDIIIMMNTGFTDGSRFPIDYAWPSDLIAIERKLPPEGGHRKWMTIEGKDYYIPGEICDPIGKEWFCVNDDVPRSDETLLSIYRISRDRSVNLLLNVPPDKHGLICDDYIQALQRLRKNAGI